MSRLSRSWLPVLCLISVAVFGDPAPAWAQACNTGGRAFLLGK